MSKGRIFKSSLRSKGESPLQTDYWEDILIKGISNQLSNPKHNYKNSGWIYFSFLSLKCFQSVIQRICDYNVPESIICRRNGLDITKIIGSGLSSWKFIKIWKNWVNISVYFITCRYFSLYRSNDNQVKLIIHRNTLACSNKAVAITSTVQIHCCLTLVKGT